MALYICFYIINIAYYRSQRAFYGINNIFNEIQLLCKKVKNVTTSF